MKEQILKLREQGKSYREIQQELGCSKGTISYHLGEGQKEKYKKYNQARKKRNRDWIENIKSTLFCSKCGESRWWVLDFHHRNPEEKDKNVAILLQEASKERVLKEIEKCDILCSNCHRNLHYQENIT